MIRKFLHILLASMVLLSSTGLITHFHYCQNELKEFSFFVEADPCPMEMAKVSCPFHQGMEHEVPVDKDCCEDETHYLKMEVVEEAQEFQADIQQDFQSADFIPQNELAIYEAEIRQAHYLNYKPPLIFRDFQSQFQSFLC
ncbi:MAG: hypothetical protein AAF696_02990 [Bacteroidota bacterium]